MSGTGCLEYHIIFPEDLLYRQIVVAYLLIEKSLLGLSITIYLFQLFISSINIIEVP
jgi:hypothetical protein